jgi:two-component system sensor histidine kinase KdpD
MHQTKSLSDTVATGLERVRRTRVDRSAGTGRPLFQAPYRYVVVIVAVAATSIALVPLRSHLSVLNTLILYLLLCLALALAVGPGPAALAAVLSFLAFNFFFVPPIHTLRVAHGDHLLALVAFLGVAVVTGQLVARIRTRTEMAIREQRRTALLYELNAALIGDVTLDAILATIVERVVRIYGAASCRILQPSSQGTLKVTAHFPPSASPALDRQHLAVAAWAMTHGQAAGRGRSGRRMIAPQGTRPGAGLMAQAEADVLYLPIRTADRTIGVLEVTGRPGGGSFGPSDEHLLFSFADQAALAIDRARLTKAAAETAALAESDAFKTTLLAALSHDLRTPLAVIKASSTALLDTSVAWEAQARSELLHAIDEEADRLSQMVSNLLDLTRLEGAVLQPDKQWYDVAEVVADVVDRPGLQLAEHAVTMEITPDLPLVRFDYVQIAQVLINLLENAAKYTTESTPIRISAQEVPGAVEITVSDSGPGIPASEFPHLFDAFYRAPADWRIPGTGIGLAICKGFVEAHGGQIWVESQLGEGTSFRFTLPLEEAEDELSGE